MVKLFSFVTFRLMSTAFMGLSQRFGDVDFRPYSHQKNKKRFVKCVKHDKLKKKISKKIFLLLLKSEINSKFIYILYVQINMHFCFFYSDQ